MARRNLHRLLIVCALLGATLVSIDALADAPPRLVNYQGRLKDAVGEPVPDGSYLMRFTVWDDSTGGIELWSETQSVTTEDGLFTTELGKTAGFFDICAPCDVWLQTQVQSQGSFTTLLPRQRLVSVPYALVSGGVTGSRSSGSTTGTIRMQASPDSGVDEIVFNDGLGTEMKVKEKANKTKCSSNLRQLGPTNTHEVEHSCDSAGARGVLTGMSGSTTGTIRMEATSTGVISSDEMDMDNDGKAESKNRRMINADAKLKAIFARDSNDDGTDDMSFETSVDDDSATLRLNGLPPGTPVEGDYTMSASGSGARGVLSGMSGSTTGTIRMIASPDSGVDEIVFDDGAGTEMKVKEKANKTKC